MICPIEDMTLVGLTQDVLLSTPIVDQMGPTELKGLHILLWYEGNYIVECITPRFPKQPIGLIKPRGNSYLLSSFN